MIGKGFCLLERGSEKMNQREPTQCESSLIEAAEIIQWGWYAEPTTTIGMQERRSGGHNIVWEPGKHSVVLHAFVLWSLIQEARGGGDLCFWLRDRIWLGIAQALFRRLNPKKVCNLATSLHFRFCAWGSGWFLGWKGSFSRLESRSKL